MISLLMNPDKVRMNPEERRMNQMNLMNHFEGLWHEKKFFHVFGCLLAGFCFIEVHRAGVDVVFGSFSSIFFILLVTTMNQMYIDEPLSKFKRFFAFVNFTDEPSTYGDLHQGSFGSLRNGGMMKKVMTVFLALLSLLLAGCGSPGAVQAAGVIGTAGPTATRTVTPSPTVGWQATAVAAQATADEARRVNAQATAQHEAFELEKIRVTEGAEIREHEKFSGTATAAMTAVPLTGTARAEDMTAMNAYMTLSAGQLTATHEAPTQAAAMVQVGYERRFGWVNYVAMGCLAFLFFGLGVFALGRSRGGGEPMVTHQQTVREEPEIIVPVKETVVNVKTATGQGWGRDRLMRVPCSPEQLTELAERVIMQNESLGVNNFEGAKSLLTRAVILQVRHFMQSNELASSIRAGRVELTEDGRAFLRGWLEKHSLPHSFEFDGEDGQKPGVMSHEHEAHVSAHGGGV